MTAPNSATSSVEVATDPHTAFTVFTEELDCWWIQGPINFFDAARAYSVRIEPGVGGRIIEVYDGDTGEGLEVARITVWDPPARLGWQSSVDDVQIDVSFVPRSGGTLVQVLATIPEGGVDRGGTAWVRTTPKWFGRWIERRDHVPHEPMRMSRLALAVYYDKPAIAAQWLRDVFGFDPAGDVPETEAGDDHHTWIELHIGNASLMVFRRECGAAEHAPVTHTPWVFVDDVDAHYERTRTAGVTIVDELWQHGARAYTAADLAGNHWTFAQASPHMRG